MELKPCLFCGKLCNHFDGLTPYCDTDCEERGKTGMHNYAFDIKLYGVIRITAKAEADAREIIDRVLSCMDLSSHTIDGFNDGLASNGETVKLTEVSLTTEDGEPFLFELDGEEQN